MGVAAKSQSVKVDCVFNSAVVFPVPFELPAVQISEFQKQLVEALSLAKGPFS